MSYDFSMSADLGGDKRRWLQEFDLNCTFNVSPMFNRAFGEHASPTETDCDGAARHGILSIVGRTGAEAAPVLDEAIAYFEAHKVELEALNPANGWGSYEGALETLRTLRKWCDEASSAVMECYY